MTHERLAACFVCGLCAALSMAGFSYGQDDEEFVVVKAGRVITVSGEEYSPGTIVIVDGKIRLVGGTGLEYPDTAKVIDARRQTVMPGFIHPRSRFQLPTYQRKGVHGDLSAGDEIYPAQIDFDELLEAGYTTVCFYPGGTGAPGVASVYRTAGPDDVRRLLDDSYLRITMTDAGRDKKVFRGALEKAKKEIAKVEKARKEWEKKQKEKAEAQKKKEQEKKPEGDKPKPKPEPKPKPKPEPKPKPKGEPANASGAAEFGGDRDDKPGKVEPDAPKEEKNEVFEPPKIDPAHQPFVDLIQEKADVPALVELRRASDLRHVDDVLKPYDKITPQYYLTVGFNADYNYVVGDLGERSARVIVSPGIFYLPYTVVRYNLGAKLAKAGCEVAFVPWRDSGTEFERIRTRLADLMRAGLDRQDALKGLTLHAAPAVGLGDRLGSIEKDKDADLVFFNGDPLRPGSKPMRVMILGEIVWKAEDR